VAAGVFAGRRERPLAPRALQVGRGAHGIDRQFQLDVPLAGPVQTMQTGAAQAAGL